MISNVKIKITSTIFQIVDDSRENDKKNAKNRKTDSDENVEKIEYTAFGKYREENGECSIEIDEPKELELGESKTTISFRPDEKNKLSLSRDGFTSFMLALDLSNPVFESVYTIFGKSFDFTVHTSKVLNTVKNGRGSILCDYSLFSRGVKFERIRLFYEVGL